MENCKKTSREQKNFARLEKIFYLLISRSLKNSGMNKNHSFFAPLSNFVQHQNDSNFFTRFISRFENHSNKIDLKKDVSNTPLRVVKKTAPQ